MTDSEIFAQCPRVELVCAIHSLASNFENAAAFLTGEDLAKAMGDIAHARSIAAKHNQNGPGCAGTTPTPIPVAERLPGEEDCDGEGRCWWWSEETSMFCGYWQIEADGIEREPEPTHWLPANALPLPAAPGEGA